MKICKSVVEVTSCYWTVAKATSYVLVAVVFFLLLTQELGNGWTNFHQIFMKRRLYGVSH